MNFYSTTATLQQKRGFNTQHLATINFNEKFILPSGNVTLEAHLENSLPNGRVRAPSLPAPASTSAPTAPATPAPARAASCLIYSRSHGHRPRHGSCGSDGHYAVTPHGGSRASPAIPRNIKCVRYATLSPRSPHATGAYWSRGMMATIIPRIVSRAITQGCRPRVGRPAIIPFGIPRYLFGGRADERREEDRGKLVSGENADFSTWQ